MTPQNYKSEYIFDAISFEEKSKQGLELGGAILPVNENLRLLNNKLQCHTQQSFAATMHYLYFCLYLYTCICVCISIFVFVFACLHKKLQRQTALPAGGE